LAVFNKILVPCDISQSSDRALEFAVKIAIEGKDSELMHIIPSFPMPNPSARSFQKYYISQLPS
jgi:hypothetical protein